MLFNCSFCKGLVPAEWKEAIVTPVFKKRSMADPLVTVQYLFYLSVASRVQERLVFNKLYPSLSDILSDRQSGFRKGDGTHIQLICLVQIWLSALNTSAYIATVFFDLKKAF